MLKDLQKLAFSPLPLLFTIHLIPQNSGKGSVISLWRSVHVSCSRAVLFVVIALTHTQAASHMLQVESLQILDLDWFSKKKKLNYLLLCWIGNIISKYRGCTGIHQSHFLCYNMQYLIVCLCHSPFTFILIRTSLPSLQCTLTTPEVWGLRSPPITCIWDSCFESSSGHWTISTTTYLIGRCSNKRQLTPQQSQTVEQHTWLQLVIHRSDREHNSLKLVYPCVSLLVIELENSSVILMFYTVKPG